jgi:hypothetical protein
MGEKCALEKNVRWKLDHPNPVGVGWSVLRVQGRSPVKGCKASCLSRFPSPFKDAPPSRSEL